ncbi:hypothetical protein B6K86_08640 [Lachnospiraceae bacterium]|nr:hypothetical protein B6K86_08640 [Lachnospiraceae bacterium]
MERGNTMEKEFIAVITAADYCDREIRRLKRELKRADEDNTFLLVVNILLSITVPIAVILLGLMH